MTRKKSFVQRIAPASIDAPCSESQTDMHHFSSVVQVPKNPTSIRSLDFGPWYGLNIDEITHSCQLTVSAFIESPGLTTPTAISYYSGIKHFLNYCSLMAAVNKGPLKLDAINKELIGEFIGYLSRLGNIKYTTQRSIFTQVKAVLTLLSDRKHLPPPDSLFPRNPYPSSNSFKKGEVPYSESERERLILAIKKDIAAIFNGRFEQRMSEAISVCLLAISLRTGRNTQPMLELTRDSLKEHPLAPNLRLLVTHKRRSHRTQLTVVSGAKDDEATTFTSVQMDAVAIFQQIEALTSPLAVEAPSEIADSLWLYRSQAHRSIGQVKSLNAGSLTSALSTFVERHDLRADNGMRLAVNLSRLRKTLADRLWRLSGGDPFAVARVLGDTVRVTDAHYLRVTPELEHEWKFMGESIVADMSSKSKSALSDVENTPVGRCKAPFDGKPGIKKDGNPCIDFLSCFSCTNYVITNDERDLYRLYSFYWFLIQERNSLGASRWARVYGWIIKVIDTQVTFKFDQAVISRIREQARREPHPYWSTDEVLESVRGA